MVLVNSTNNNMKLMQGLNVTSTPLTDGFYRFRCLDNSMLWTSKVLSLYIRGNYVVYETEHSTYEFRLTEGEQIIMGATVNKFPNPLWEMERGFK